MKLTRSIAATTLFTLVLILIYYIHITFFKINVVFYAALSDVVVASLVSGIALMLAEYFRILSGFEKYQLLVIWLLTGYALAISAPTVIDRSLSLYILEKLQQRGGEIKQEAFEQIFTQEFVKEHRLVAVRLTEQVESGTIIIEDGCVKLTDKGRLISTFSRFYRQNLLPKKRLLLDQYSDDLTNPFRHSIEYVNYLCH